MRGSKWVSAAATMALLLGAMGVPATAEAQSVNDKLKRGIANVALGVLELPATILEESRNSNPVQGLTVGLVKGVYRTVRRELAGAFEVVTFPAEMPAGYAPLLEPEYPWDHFE